MSRYHQNSLLALEQSTHQRTKPRAWPRVRQSSLITIAQSVHATEAPVTSGVVSGNFSSEIPAARIAGSAVLPEPVGASQAHSLNTALPGHRVQMNSGGVSISAELTARPLSSEGRRAEGHSDFFDSFEQPQDISPEAVFGADTQLIPEPEPQNAGVAPLPEGEPYMREPLAAPSDQEASVNRLSDTEERAEESSALNDSHDFLSEMDAITAMSHRRSNKAVPKAYSKEIDNFRKELDSVVGGSRSDSDKGQGQAPSQPAEQESSPYQGTSQGLSSHSVFDRLGQKPPYANSFNLGSVDVGDHFDQFDVELEREEVRTQSRIASELGLSDLDVISDLTEISEAHDESGTSVTQPEKQTNDAGQPVEQQNSAEPVKQESQQAVAIAAEEQAETNEPSIRDTSGYQVPVILSSDTITPWAAGAAMLVGWKEHWQAEELSLSDGPLADYRERLLTTDAGNLDQWPIEPVSTPDSFTDWADLLRERGPLLLGAADQVLVLTELNHDTHFIRPDQGKMDVAFEDFEELLARLQLDDHFIVTALISDATPIEQG